MQQRAAVQYLRVDFGVEARIADEVDDPGLSCLLVHAQLVRQHLQVDALVYPAVRLEDQQPRVLHEVVLRNQRGHGLNGLTVLGEILDQIVWLLNSNRVLPMWLLCAVRGALTLCSGHLERGEEEVVLQHRLALGQLLLCALEVEVHVQVDQELRDRVLVLVLLLLCQVYCLSSKLL
jgi:hypothetical protein